MEIFRPRPVGSPSSLATFVSCWSDPFDQVPTPDMIEIFEGRLAQSSDMPDSPSSHASLQSMLRDLFYAAAFDDVDDDHMQSPTLNGGANDGFQPSKADISKLVQKLKCVDHHFAPKQIRMLLVSDQKILKKIERTSDAKQLLSCVQAAAVRMGLQVPEAQKPKESSSIANGFSIANAPLPFSTKDGKGKGKNPTAPSDKGKGKGKQPNTFNSPNENVNHKNQGKGRGKSKNHEANNNAPSAAKSKGKGQMQTITHKLEPDGWNVLPLDTFVPSHGGVYVCEKLEQAKRIAEQGVGKNFPIGVLSPFPMDIGVKAPEIIFAEFTKYTGDGSHRISMQAYLHQITYADVVYRKTAPSVNIRGLLLHILPCVISPLPMRARARKQNLSFSKNDCRLSNNGFPLYFNIIASLKFLMFGMRSRSAKTSRSQPIRFLLELLAHSWSRCLLCQVLANCR